MKHPEVFRAEGLPLLQNRTFPTAAEARSSPTGDVVLVEDAQTGLIRNAAFEPERMVYDRDYQNEQACSPVFRRHLGEVAQIVERHLRGRPLIEIGCGKAYFLEQLRGLGFRITGVDPAYEGDDPDVIRTHFDKRLGLSADGIVLRHVLEHIENPAEFLADIADANGGRGTIYIEVPCFDWILGHRAWFDIFYEHVNYFRLDDFARMFGRIHERGHVFGGQYLYVVADLATVRRPVARAGGRVAVPADFLAGIDDAVARVRAGAGRRHVIWGGASKGVIFAIYLKRAGIELDGAIDINPAKQRRFLAVTGLRVSPPDELLGGMTTEDTVFVMNSNYLDEIVASTGNQYAYVTVDHERA
jgi:hypothetical protein